MFRDFSSGGFLMDDENANPRRKVALYARSAFKYKHIHHKFTFEWCGGGEAISGEQPTGKRQTYRVGDGGGYEMPLWLGDSKFVCPPTVPMAGTSSVLFDMCAEFKFKFGKL